MKHANTIIMKKLVLFIVALLSTAATLSAQTSQVATLSHEGQISTFYSANAFKDAYSAAVDGDIITLSSGSFQPCDIQKSITVRGAGMMPDGNPTIFPTYISIGGRTDTDKKNITIEGILFNGGVSFYNTVDSRLIKCYFSGLSVTYVDNGSILHCIIKRFTGSSTVSLFDSYIISDKDINYANFTNCVLLAGELSRIMNSSLKNCIIYPESSATQLPNSSTASYCYHIGGNTSIFSDSPSTTNVVDAEATIEDVFENTTTFELNDGYAQKWLGDDGTQAGMHGGSIPFDPTPTNPQITKFNVAPKTTADGKLSVDIEVKAN